MELAILTCCSVIPIWITESKNLSSLSNCGRNIIVFWAPGILMFDTINNCFYCHSIIILKVSQTQWIFLGTHGHLLPPKLFSARFALSPKGVNVNYLMKYVSFKTIFFF